LKQQGHDVRLIAAQFVKPFVKSNKNDFVDAEAIAEANVRSTAGVRVGNSLPVLVLY
jgi:transposase